MRANLLFLIGSMAVGASMALKCYVCDPDSKEHKCKDKTDSGKEEYCGEGSMTCESIIKTTGTGKEYYRSCSKTKPGPGDADYCGTSDGVKTCNCKKDLCNGAPYFAPTCYVCQGPNQKCKNKEDKGRFTKCPPSTIACECDEVTVTDTTTGKKKKEYYRRCSKDTVFNFQCYSLEPKVVNKVQKEGTRCQCQDDKCNACESFNGGSVKGANAFLAAAASGLVMVLLKQLF